MSNFCCAHNHIPNVCDNNVVPLNYTHYKVNHRLEFENPSNSMVHTQTIAKFCGDLKDNIKGRGNGRTIELSIFNCFCY